MRPAFKTSFTPAFKQTFEAAVRQHDAQVAALGLTIWVGSEPTFTDRQALTPAWLRTALGDDKAQRAKALLGSLKQRLAQYAAAAQCGPALPW